MAYVPDDAIARKRDEKGERIISGAAWEVYEQLCASADPETGIVEARYATNQRLADKTRLALGTVRNKLTELRQKHWIEEDGRRIYLRVGTFLKDLKEQRKQKNDQRQSSLNSDNSSLGSDALSSVNDGLSPMSDGAYIGSRARSYQPTDQPIQDQPAHTSQAIPSPPREQLQACVCKVPHGSEFCDDERLSIATHQPSIKVPSSYAQAKEVRAGRDDHLLRK